MNWTPVKRIDRSILLCEPESEELLSFYFDKFNFHKRDINPFTSKNNIKLD